MRLLLIFLLPLSLTASDWQQIWDLLLREHVKQGSIDGVPTTAIDYRAVEADPRWLLVLRGLEVSKAPTDVEGQLAYWTNAYNVLAVKMVLIDYPTKSIRDNGTLFGSVWKREAGVADGKMRSLDEVEHAILRKLGEPLIHAGIVCASVSCPDLRAEAYTSERVREQLREQMVGFLANDKKGALRQGDTLYLSAIFDWFGEDFGKDEAARLATLGAWFEVGKPRKVRYLDYNWSLNDSARFP